MVLTRPVAEASGVAREDACALGQFRAQAKVGAHRLARRREARKGEAPGQGVGTRGDQNGVVLEFPFIGDAGVGVDPVAEAPGELVAAARDEGIALEVGEVHRGGGASALPVAP